MASKLDLLLEAERRGLNIPEDKKALLTEARKRGLVSGGSTGGGGGSIALGDPLKDLVGGQKAVGDFLLHAVQKLKDTKPVEQTTFSRQGGTLSQPVQAKSAGVPGGIVDLAKRSALPVAGGAIGSAFGGIPGGMLGSAVGEGANQAFGITDPSLSEMAISALPLPIGRGATRLTKSVPRGGAGFVAPQAMRESGVELAKQTLTRESSKDLFAQVAKQGRVPTHGMMRALDRATVDLSRRATAKPSARKVLKELQPLREKISRRMVPTKESVIETEGFVPVKRTRMGQRAVPVKDIDYQDILTEVQSLRHQANNMLNAKSPDRNAAIEMHKAANAILDEMSKVSTLIKKANAAYRREQSVVELAKKLRMTSPGSQIRNLFEEDALIAETFSKVEQKMIIDLADDIGRFATGATLGAGNRFIMAMSEGVADMLTTDNGRALLRFLIQQPGMTAQQLSGAVSTILNMARRQSFEFRDSNNPAP